MRYWKGYSISAMTRVLGLSRVTCRTWLQSNTTCSPNPLQIWSARFFFCFGKKTRRDPDPCQFSMPAVPIPLVMATRRGHLGKGSFLVWFHHKCCCFIDPSSNLIFFSWNACTGLWVDPSLNSQRDFLEVNCSCSKGTSKYRDKLTATTISSLNIAVRPSYPKSS